MKTLQHRADRLNALVGRDNAYQVLNGKITYKTNFTPAPLSIINFQSIPSTPQPTLNFKSFTTWIWLGITGKGWNIIKH